MNTICIYISGEPDIADAARKARTMASSIGFASEQSLLIATVASELASNLFIHAGGGIFVISRLCHPDTAEYAGLEMVTTDNGPGIADIALALQEGYSTIGARGLGLSGVQQLMDELEIDSRAGQGSVVRARKWL